MSDVYNLDVGQAFERGKTDFNFFAGLCLPNICIYALPLFYLAAWNIIRDGNLNKPEAIFRFALGLPRGHAKTTFLKVLIAWMIVYDKVKFILLICASAPLAENILVDIDDILSSDNITAIYGDWNLGKTNDSMEKKTSYYHNKFVSIAARGWQSGVRGLNLKNERPDFIFCDDAQTKANAESDTDSAKLLNELTGSIFKAIAPRGRRRIVYVGNQYRGDGCVLEKLRNNPRWVSLITGAILEDGQPLWPELISLEELQETFEHDESLGQADTWFAEVMNNPQMELTTLLPNQLPPSDLTSIEAHDGAFMTIDPAGFRDVSDDNVIAVGVKFDNRGYCIASDKGIKDPEELIKRAIELALQHNVTLIGVEAVAYQQTLMFWLNKYLTHLGISHITVVELSPHGRSKESRIRTLVSEIYAGNFVIHDPATRRAFTWQGGMYKFGKKKNKDDLLDAIAYFQDIRTDFWHLLVPIYSAEGTIDTTKCAVVGNNTPF